MDEVLAILVEVYRYRFCPVDQAVLEGERYGEPCADRLDPEP